MRLPATSYSQRYVVFIDVLGFGSLISSSAKDEVVAGETIRRVSTAILLSIDELASNSNFNFKFTQFSDSFVLSSGARADEVGNLSMFILAVLNVIDCFLGEGFLLRGGITHGQLIHKNKLLFGPAMNRAYELESSIAKFPRIILDPNLPRLADELLPLLKVLKKDEDGYFYVDYFFPRKAFYLLPEYWLALQAVIAAIPQTPELMHKRAWLVAKYDDVLSRFSYDAFKTRLDEYVDVTNNVAVVVDYQIFLDHAKKLHYIQSMSTEEKDNHSTDMKSRDEL